MSASVFTSSKITDPEIDPVQDLALAYSPDNPQAIKEKLSSSQLQASTSTQVNEANNEPIMEKLVREVLETLGENPDRDGLKATPSRVRRSLAFLTSGYQPDPISILGQAIFQEEYDEMVVVRDIEFYSLCEHHLLPFYGNCHIAYIPAGKIVGLSKLPRLVEVYSHRLQIQERLTTQLAETINALLQPKAVGVIVEGRHLCLMMRGIQKQNTHTTTSALLGALRYDEKLRQEFLQKIKRFGLKIH
jgi:GTP cyclohydrolase I